MDASPGAKAFFDTNVLVYAFDYRDLAKQERAASLLTEHAGAIVISGQVLSEFYWTVTRKLPSPLTRDEALTAISLLSRFTVVPIERDLVLTAIELGDTTSIAFWDALIVKAASTSGCARLLTEDLSHGQTVDGIRVEDPFVSL